MGCCQASSTGKYEDKKRQSGGSTSSSGSAQEVGAPRPVDEVTDEDKLKASRKRRKEIEAALSSRHDCRELPLGIHKQLNDGVAVPLKFQSKQSSGTASSDMAVSLSFTNASTCASQMHFADRDQTIIIFDWDDTLCPSTFLRTSMQYDHKGRLAVRLDEKVRSEIGILAERAFQLLQVAKAMGKVVIVTNAKRPWVQVSCRDFLPTLTQMIQDVPILYAPELMKDGGGTFEGFSGCRLTEAKAIAMKAAVTDFYARYPNQSWKNIVSLGDAFFEHHAIRQVVETRPQIKKACRTKTIKMLEHPTIAGMIVQLSIICGWLVKVVQADNDVDIDLSADAETVDKWSSQYSAS